MKNNLIILFALLLFAGCDYNDKYFEGYDEDAIPTDVKSLEYTLTDADYATIAGYAVNKKIAKAAGDSALLANLATTKLFTGTFSASLYLPAFVAEKWFTGDEGSAVKIIHNGDLSLPDYVAELKGIDIYKPSSADYETVWGEGSKINYFTPTVTADSHLPAILANAYPNVEEGTVVLVDYNQSENEPGGAVVALNEDFAVVTGSVTPAVIDGWHNVTTVGTYAWNGRFYATESNGYIQASANGHTAGAMEAYMISPKIDIISDMNLTFRACYGYYMEEGGRVTVLVSTDLAGFEVADINEATWDDITSSFSIEIPTSNYGTLKPAGSHNLDKYAGKKVYIAFRYNGNGTKATTTVQIDDVAVIGGSADKYTVETKLYAYDGSAWAIYSGDGYLMTKADYALFGIKYDNFSGTQADYYLPRFLNQKYPFAEENAVKVIAYKYFASSKTTVQADEYVCTGTGWTKVAATGPVTSQFVKKDNEWKFDPSVVITLLPTKNELSVLYYQTATDWVWENIDKAILKLEKKGLGYVKSYGDAEYYTGCSAYYGNIDMRPDKAKEQYATGYEGMTDDEVVAKMREHLIEVMQHVLVILHPEADLAPDPEVEVLYTLRVGIYTGTTITNVTHQLVYKVTGKGKFEYVPDSFKPIQ